MHALAVILGVIGAVLAVAIALLLIWRVLATIQVSSQVVLQHPSFKPSPLVLINRLSCSDAHPKFSIFTSKLQKTQRNKQQTNKQTNTNNQTKRTNQMKLLDNGFR